MCVFLLSSHGNVELAWNTTIHTHSNIFKSVGMRPPPAHNRQSFELLKFQCQKRTLVWPNLNSRPNSLSRLRSGPRMPRWIKMNKSFPFLLLFDSKFLQAKKLVFNEIIFLLQVESTGAKQVEARKKLLGNLKSQCSSKWKHFPFRLCRLHPPRKRSESEIRRSKKAAHGKQ